MKKEILDKYADLLVNYCMELKAGESLLVMANTLSEPLVNAVYRRCLTQGIVMDAVLDWAGKAEAFASLGNEAQARYLSPSYVQAVERFDGYLVIRAPYEHSGNILPTPELAAIKAEAGKAMHQLYFERTGTRSLKRNLCQYPTPYGANAAGMTLEEYTDFIAHACFLNEDNPAEHWINVGRTQQRIVDHLNQCTVFQYLNNNVDIRFSTKGRTWINSDGKTNMPSGEVYTSPEEDSVQGHITFSLPSVYQGHLLHNVRLEVKDGYIVNWSADNDVHLLDEVFAIPGTRRFGEAAIGTNYRINRLTKNILYDEKTGGTIHMAIGQSYLQAGGKNESSLHWDMITDMTQGGSILADGEEIYKDGRFLI